MIEDMIGTDNKQVITDVHKAVISETQNALSTLGVDFKFIKTVASPDNQMIKLGITMSSVSIPRESEEDQDIPVDSVLSIYKNEKLEYEIMVKYTKNDTSLNVEVITNICSNDIVI